MKKRWYDYLWIVSLVYLILGFFNILFAWLGMIDFLLPLALAIFGGNKFFCNNLCGRGQLFSLLGRAEHSAASISALGPPHLTAQGLKAHAGCVPAEPTCTENASHSAEHAVCAPFAGTDVACWVSEGKLS